MPRHRNGCSTRHILNDDIRITLQQCERFQLDERNGLHIACDKRCLTRIRIVQHQHFNLIEISAFQVPAIMTAERPAHAEFAVIDFIGAATVSGLPVDGAVFLAWANPPDGNRSSAMAGRHCPNQA